MASNPSTSRATAEELGNQLGRRVNALRRRRSYTLSNISQRTGVSVAMLSMIERGRSNPSIGTLHAIADALGVPMADLFHTIDLVTTDGEERVAVRADAQEVISTTGGVERRVILSDRGRGYEFAENRYDPGTASAPAPLHHQGYEFGFVLEGELEVMVDGRVHLIRAGDAARLDSSRPHRFRNPGPHHTRTLWVNLLVPSEGE
jgi:transcriptional regulator with XRE-family HTH domain